MKKLLTLSVFLGITSINEYSHKIQAIKTVSLHRSHKESQQNEAKNMSDQNQQDDKDMNVGFQDISKASEMIEKSENKDLQEIFGDKLLSKKYKEKTNKKNSQKNQKNNNLAQETQKIQAKDEPVNQNESVFEGQFIAQEKKKYPQNFGFTENRQVADHPQYKKMVTQILGKLPGNEYYRAVRPQDKEKRKSNYDMYNYNNGYGRGYNNYDYFNSYKSPIENIDSKYKAHDANFGYDRFLQDKFKDIDPDSLDNKLRVDEYDNYYDDYSEMNRRDPDRINEFFKNSYDLDGEFDQQGAHEGFYPLDHIVEEKEYLSDLFKNGYSKQWDSKGSSKQNIDFDNIAVGLNSLTQKKSVKPETSKAKQVIVKKEDQSKKQVQANKKEVNQKSSELNVDQQIKEINMDAESKVLYISNKDLESATEENQQPQNLQKGKSSKNLSENKNNQNSKADSKSKSK